jgi:hypothetical protein
MTFFLTFEGSIDVLQGWLEWRSRAEGGFENPKLRQDHCCVSLIDGEVKLAQEPLTIRIHANTLSRRGAGGKLHQKVARLRVNAPPVLEGQREARPGRPCSACSGSHMRRDVVSVRLRLDYTDVQAISRAGEPDISWPDLAPFSRLYPYQV